MTTTQARSYPTSPAEITSEWLTTALRQSGAITKANVRSFDSKVIGEGAGLLGELVKLSLQYDKAEPDAPRSLIAKFPAAAQENRDVAMFFRSYEREVNFYEQIAEQVELRTPRCYFSAFEPETGDYVLLLEDLAPAVVGDQLAGCSAEHAELAISELAKFHATWWNSPELQKLDWMPSYDAEWYIKAAEDGYAQAWEPFVGFTKDYLTPELSDVGQRFGKSIRKVMNRLGNELPATIVHGDYRLDNLFFASPQGGAPFAVIDWQISSKGGGIFDVAYFVAGTLPEAERRATERDLVKLYHNTLDERGVKDYSVEQCWQDYRLSALLLLAYSVITLGSLDLANERGVELFTTISKRTLAAITDLKSAELLPS
jgi:aminoglycoside/choline kinase family phosphotransferase